VYDEEKGEIFGSTLEQIRSLLLRQKKKRLEVPKKCKEDRQACKGQRDVSQRERRLRLRRRKHTLFFSKGDRGNFAQRRKKGNTKPRLRRKDKRPAGLNQRDVQDGNIPSREIQKGGFNGKRDIEEQKKASHRGEKLQRSRCNREAKNPCFNAPASKGEKNDAGLHIREGGWSGPWGGKSASKVSKGMRKSRLRENTSD